MSRVAKNPVDLPQGVTATVNDGVVSVKGARGALSYALHPDVTVSQGDQRLQVAVREGADAARLDAVAGSTRAHLANMVNGVSKGFERKLELVGVGYRAQMAGKDLSLSLGFSHPVVFKTPEGITIETPTQTEILVKGSDKQMVGQVAAKIRAFRPPEPYKGKGVKYSDETIIRKEAKKA